MEKDMDKNEREEREEREKRLLLWSGIAFIMVFILFLWGLNIRNSLYTINQETREASSEVDLNFMMEEVDERMEEVKNAKEEESTDSSGEAAEGEEEQESEEVPRMEPDELLRSIREEIEK